MFDLSLTETVLTSVATIVVAWVTAHTGQMGRRIDKLKDRVAELEDWRDSEEGGDASHS